MKVSIEEIWSPWSAVTEHAKISSFRISSRPVPANIQRNISEYKVGETIGGLLEFWIEKWFLVLVLSGRIHRFATLSLFDWSVHQNNSNTLPSHSLSRNTSDIWCNSTGVHQNIQNWSSAAQTFTNQYLLASSSIKLRIFNKLAERQLRDN